jgi:hypothetical protein
MVNNDIPKTKFKLRVPRTLKAKINEDAVIYFDTKKEAENSLSLIRANEISLWDFNVDFENTVDYEKVEDTWDQEDLIDEAAIEEVAADEYKDGLCVTLNLHYCDFQDMPRLMERIQSVFDGIRVLDCKFEAIEVIDGSNFVKYDIYPMNYFRLDPLGDGVDIYYENFKEKSRIEHYFTNEQLQMLFDAYCLRMEDKNDRKSNFEFIINVMKLEVAHKGYEKTIERAADIINKDDLYVRAFVEKYLLVDEE